MILKKSWGRAPWIGKWTCPIWWTGGDAEGPRKTSSRGLGYCPNFPHQQHRRLGWERNNRLDVIWTHGGCNTGPVLRTGADSVSGRVGVCWKGGGGARYPGRLSTMTPVQPMGLFIIDTCCLLPTECCLPGPPRCSRKQSEQQVYKTGASPGKYSRTPWI